MMMEFLLYHMVTSINKINFLKMNNFEEETVEKTNLYPKLPSAPEEENDFVKLP